MNHQKLEDQIIAWFEGDLKEEERKKLFLKIEKSKEAKDIFETYENIYQDFEEDEMVQPSESFQENFHAKLEEEKSEPEIRKEGKVLSIFKLWKYAAAIIFLVAVGILIGQNRNNQEINHLSQDLEVIKKLLKNESTALRIKAVKMSNDFDETDQEILKILIKTMNSDKSENVRLAAIDALEKFSNVKAVKLAFLDALDKSNEDFIQIKLIRILADKNERNALPFFNEIIENKTSSKYLKTEATIGRKAIINL